MRFGIVGCGVIGRLHAATIASFSPRAELVAVADNAPERARELGEEYAVASVGSVEELLDLEGEQSVDVVAICTPSGLHADAAVAALDAGKHVIIEKPLDIDLDRARKVAAACQRNDQVAMVVSQHRHDRASLIVHEALQADRFGRLTSGTATMAWWRSQEYYASGDWRGTWEYDGGGALMNQGIHTVDLLAWFLGRPVEVFAWTDCLAHERIEVEDTAVATVRFDSGALGIVYGTTAAYPGLTTRVQVHGDRGSAVIEHDDLVYFHAATDAGERYDYGAGGRGNQAEGVLAARPASEPSGDGAAGLSATSHTDQYDDFLTAVEQGRQPLVSVEQATQTLALIRGIYESARTGKPVRIEELTT